MILGMEKLESEVLTSTVSFVLPTDRRVIHLVLFAAMFPFSSLFLVSTRSHALVASRRRSEEIDGNDE